jgi:hypothetical protein
MIKNLNLSKLSINKNIAINPNKEKDLRSLFQYLSNDNKKYYCKYLNEIKCESINKVLINIVFIKCLNLLINQN